VDGVSVAVEVSAGGNVRAMLDTLLELGDVVESERGHVRRYWRLVAGS
jgi:hypothetical protein